MIYIATLRAHGYSREPTGVPELYRQEQSTYHTVRSAGAGLSPHERLT